MFAVFTLAAVFSAAQGRPDPCLPGNHKELTEVRSTGYTVTYPEVPLCDDSLESGWYRFTSPGGGEMPTHRIDRNRCGTVVPIWMKGDHPAVGDGHQGIVSRTACANFETGKPGDNADGCADKLNIAVKNCDNKFYVYYLHPTPGCPIAYCAGSRVPCAAGQWSEEGRFPVDLGKCRDAYPKLSQSPVLKGPLVCQQGGKFHFSCEFKFPGQDPKQAFEVAWTFGGSEVSGLPSQVVTDPVRHAVLDGTKLKDHLGKYLGCKVRAYFTDHPDNTRGPWLDSNVYWAGVRPDDYYLEVSEEDELRNVTLTSTIPLVCQGADENTCCVDIRLHVSGRPDKLDTGVSCKWPLCDFLWNDATKSASLPIPVSASKDQVSDGKTDLLLTFQNLQADKKLGPYAAVFNKFQIASVQVGVVEADTKTCTLVSDPHITGLNGNRFDLFRVGDFTIYENKERHFEVQVRTWPCWGGGATCVCGVAVRELDDLVRIDGCADSYYLHGQASPQVRLPRRDAPLRLGTSVEQATDGSMIVVHLPSGAEVSVKGRNSGQTRHYLDVTLKVPASDKGKGRGLCGTFDDKTNNEFTHRNGLVDTMCSGCEPKAFINSWKNGRTTSLFRTVPARLDQLYIRKFCQCDAGNNRAHCSLRPNPTLLCQPNCDEIQECVAGHDCNIETDNTQEDDPFPWLTGGWNKSRRPRAVADYDYVDQDADDSGFDPDDYGDAGLLDSTEERKQTDKNTFKGDGNPKDNLV